MRALAADREGRPLDMPDHPLQHVFLRAVADREFQLKPRDFDIAHHAVAVEVQQGFIRCFLPVGQVDQPAVFENLPVKRLRLLEQPLVIGRVRPRRLLVMVDGDRLRTSIDIVGDRRIEHNAQPQHKDQHNRQHR